MGDSKINKPWCVHAEQIPCVSLEPSLYRFSAECFLLIFLQSNNEIHILYSVLRHKSLCWMWKLQQFGQGCGFFFGLGWGFLVRCFFFPLPMRILRPMQYSGQEFQVKKAKRVLAFFKLKFASQSKIPREPNLLDCLYLYEYAYDTVSYNKHTCNNISLLSPPSCVGPNICDKRITSRRLTI